MLPYNNSTPFFTVFEGEKKVAGFSYFFSRRDELSCWETWEEIFTKVLIFREVGVGICTTSVHTSCIFFFTCALFNKDVFSCAQ